jgi:hypothetical protein
LLNLTHTTRKTGTGAGGFPPPGGVGPIGHEGAPAEANSAF